MEQSVEQADRSGVLEEELSPPLGRPVGPNTERPPFIGGSDQAEKQLSTGRVHRGEPDLVDEDEVGPQDLGDHLAHRVVGDGPIEGLDQFGGGEVANAVTAFDSLVSGGGLRMARSV